MVSYPGGMSFADNPDQVRLADFRFRTRDRFFYQYNFHVPWRHAIRVEQIAPHAPDQRYPVCIAGARAAPPEACSGPHAFLRLRQHYHPHNLIERLLALLDEPDEYDAPYDELHTLRYWAAVNRCDRRAINRQREHPDAPTPGSEAR
jgi:Plasmid pRiA4b ORF-3-like protein